MTALEEEYGRAQRVQDFDTCGSINLEREPLFKELWELERNEADQYWIPVRIRSQGRVEPLENVRRGIK